MLDATEWILGALVIVLGGAAFAVGGQVIREAWRSGFKALPGPSREHIPSTGAAGAGSTAETANTARRSREQGRGKGDRR